MGIFSIPPRTGAAALSCFDTVPQCRELLEAIWQRKGCFAGIQEEKGQNKSFNFKGIQDLRCSFYYFKLQIQLSVAL
jgi:hypothetical protein